MEIIKSVAVDTARGMRIWAEGGPLARMGWIGGTKYVVEYGAAAGEIWLTKSPDGTRAVTEGSRAGKARPIIELRSKKNNEVFNVGDALLITIMADHIVISVAK